MSRVSMSRAFLPFLPWGQQKPQQEDVFPDAEGWENVDPDDVAKWGVASEFSAYTPEQQQGRSGGAGERPAGSYRCRSGSVMK